MKKPVEPNKDQLEKLVKMNSSEISALRDYCILLKENETDNNKKEKYIECIVTMSAVLKKRIHDLMSEGKEQNKSDSKEDLIKEAELLLKEFKLIDKEDFSKYKNIEEKAMGEFQDKFRYHFPDAFIIFFRAFCQYYPIEIAEEFLELLKVNDYRESVQRILPKIKHPNENNF